MDLCETCGVDIDKMFFGDETMVCLECGKRSFSEKLAKALSDVSDAGDFLKKSGIKKNEF